MIGKKGFTLVELAIVLVIIGLLIGGILTAQSMIGTTKIQAQVKQIQQLDAAITNFQTKYNQLPGDSNLFGGVGNNDGMISSNIDPTISYPIFLLEVSHVWPELQQGVGLYKDFHYDVTDYCNIGGVCSFTPPNVNIIPAPINNKTGIVIAYDGPNGYVETQSNIYGLSSFDNGGAIDSSTESIPCFDAAALDTKLDDGNPDTGNVRSTEAGCGAGSGNYSSNPPGVTFMEIKTLAQTGQ